MKKLCLAATAALSLILVGCSGDPAPPAPAGSSAPPASAAPSAEPSAEPSVESTTAAPAADCLDGRYHVTTFKAVGADQSTARGKGGDLTLSFDDGSYVMQSKGKDPASITVSGETGELVLDGKVVGSYQSAGGSKVKFTAGKSSGSAKVRDAKGKERSLSLAQVAAVLAPTGEATATCDGDKLTLKTERLTLDLKK